MGSSNTSESEDDANADRIASTCGSLPGAALLINRQRAVPADWSEVEVFLGQLSRRLAKSSFSVCLLSDQGIRRYNKRFRHKNQATDVLAFPADGQGAEEKCYLGDILISVETARANAARYGLGLEEEIKILALHGLLHLMGHDHETDRGRMAREESRWRARLGLSTSLTSRARANRSSDLRQGQGRLGDR